MRRILIKGAILIAALAAFLLLWIFAGRHASLLLDRIGTARMESLPVDRLTYKGAESDGTLHIGGLSLSTQAPDYRPSSITFRPDSEQRFVVTSGGKSILLGPLSSNYGEFEITPQPGDKVSLTTRRSFFSWPTPFDLNFMSGHSPSWKRHLYYQLLWQKFSGEKLEMLWRYEQYFYPGDGWEGGMMTRENSTGLIRANILP